MSKTENKSQSQGDHPSGSFGLWKNFNSTENIYKYVQNAHFTD